MKGFPTILWFSNQETVSAWESPKILDQLKAWLEENNETYKPIPATDTDTLGHLDIFCTTPEHYQKIKAKFNELRGASD